MFLVCACMCQVVCAIFLSVLIKLNIYKGDTTQIDKTNNINYYMVLDIM